MKQRVLLCWECGANYGHISFLRAVAREFDRLGYECVFAVKDLKLAASYIPEYEYIQAPVFAPALLQKRTASFWDILHNLGAHNPQTLAAGLQSWMSLFYLVDPAYVVTSFAPFAELAASLYCDANKSILKIGSGYTLPPADFPAFYPNDPFDTRSRGNVESVFIAAKQLMAMESDREVEQILLSGQRAIFSYPELDHYQKRDEVYVGFPQNSHGIVPVWNPDYSGKKFICYLRPSATVAQLLQMLHCHRSHQFIVVLGDANETLMRHSYGNVQIMSDSINMVEAAKTCDHFINYASYGMTTEMLLAGKTGILLPDTTERKMFADRVQKMGACYVHEHGINEDHIEDLVDNAGMRLAASQFMFRHAAEEREKIIPALVQKFLQGDRV